MPFSLDQVVPWGRSFDEYRRMFALTGSDLERSILGCADGPAAFNVQLTKRGGKVVSCDPLYAFSADEIEARIHGCFDTVLEQARLHAGEFVWSNEIPDAAALGRTRWIPCGSSWLIFQLANIRSDTAPPSFLRCRFPTPSSVWPSVRITSFSTARWAFRSMWRQTLSSPELAAEVRIFPLVELNGQKSPFLPAVMEAASASELVTEIVPVRITWTIDFRSSIVALLRDCGRQLGVLSTPPPAPAHRVSWEHQGNTDSKLGRASPPFPAPGQRFQTEPL